MIRRALSNVAGLLGRRRDHAVPRAERLPRVVFLTGAGLSADSGIPTYRGDGGLYAGMHAEELMTPANLARDPGPIHDFCDDRRMALGDAEPNAAHRMIARLAERYGDRLTHITQNVDDLVERAGYAGSVHVHGNLTSMRSLSDPEVREDIGYRRYWGGEAHEAPARGFRFTDGDGGLYRPDVVLFGEQTRLYHRMFLVMGALHPDDLLVVIGTSGKIVPVNRWTENADCRKVLNNLEASNNINEDRFDENLRMPAAEAADAVAEIVTRHLG
ncbi:NAD-dependent protein deacylase [Pararhizobium sp. BT-229]|uniref:SIR2 family NAD-dependent protein deacylase n=1 Tax=Pararhizobium sp. BT-229 TaxID=2986923 RepID=UPI0021F7B0A5|nr:Sir2 family NAD-dependent protein deacetylase [Pararhizobium sp. BT-229]MCV9964165.1 NAD-dependent protein deacylase [Pararhizobium sp. BT-229]